MLALRVPSPLSWASPLASLAAPLTTYSVEYDTLAHMKPLTDSNGNWMIGGLSYGRYFIREVPDKMYSQTEPSLDWTYYIDVNNARDKS